MVLKNIDDLTVFLCVVIFIFISHLFINVNYFTLTKKIELPVIS